MRWSSASLLPVLVAALALGCSEPPAGISGQSSDAGAPGDAAAGSCDVLAQSCPPGEGCYWAGAPGAFVCAPALGLPRYHPCQTSDQCAIGDGCHLDDFFSFFCIGYCDYGANAGGPDPRCEEHELCAAFDGDVGVCLGICDALDSDCPDGLGCYHILEAADICLPVTGDGEAGDACARNNDCAPGLGCVDGETSVCATYCDHEANPDEADPRCAKGEVCGALGDGERIGACRVP
jgi:hypothetical protein